MLRISEGESTFDSFDDLQENREELARGFESASANQSVQIVSREVVGAREVEGFLYVIDIEETDDNPAESGCESDFVKVLNSIKEK